jgi:deoxyribonuclease-4
MQIFVKNANRWQQRPRTGAEIELFLQARESNRCSDEPITSILAHASYLINLAGDGLELRRKSIAALVDELERCNELGVAGLVLHPGSHLGRGVDAGIAAIGRGIDQALTELGDGECRILLENTAGQGHTLGRNLEELAAIRQAVSQPERVGVCIDTCHAFVAGQALHVLDGPLNAGYEGFWSQALELFPPPVLACIHVNDSRGGFGSCLDRHANLGQGEIGAGFFERLAQDPRFLSLPMILETPRGETDLQGYRRDLGLLRTWSARTPDPS